MDFYEEEKNDRVCEKLNVYFPCFAQTSLEAAQLGDGEKEHVE